MPKLYCVMGCAGSGKSTLSRSLAQKHNAVICSADDFCVWFGGGVYDWSPERVSAAHQFCQQMFSFAIRFGKNVIVDNTNTRVKDFRFYVESALSAEYNVEFVEPDTDWKYNAEECFKRNAHSVPLETIQRMINQIKTTKESKEFKDLLEKCSIN